MSNLLAFLTDMALDTRKQEIFADTPVALLNAAGLSKIEQLVLENRDRASITTALADELPTHELMAVMGSCFVADPGPDPSPDPDPPPDEARKLYQLNR